MKRILAFILTIVGLAGLAFGIIKLFNGNLSNSFAWISLVLGGILFPSGIGLLKTVKGKEV